MTTKEKHTAIIPDDRHIYVSGRIWDALYPKVDPAPFVYALHRGIDFDKYGPGIEKFYFTFIVTRPHNNLHQPGIHFDKTTKEFEVAVRIPYEEIVDATQLDTLHQMEEAFLAGIDRIAEIKLDSPFDYHSFREDVAAIFAQEKWYEFEELMA